MKMLEEFGRMADPMGDISRYEFDVIVPSYQAELVAKVVEGGETDTPHSNESEAV
jgi:hypothetical protein